MFDIYFNNIFLLYITKEVKKKKKSFFLTNFYFCIKFYMM